jgi:hypothetical protein
MKKLLILLLSFGLALGVSAQKGTGHIYSGHGGVYYYHPRVFVGWPAYPYGYYGWGAPYGWYPYGYPYGYGYIPSRLTIQVESIKAEFHDKIVSARHDKSLTHEERKKTIHELKAERDRKVDDLKSNYYKH